MVATIKHLASTTSLTGQITALNVDESYTCTFVPGMSSTLYARRLETYEGSLTESSTYDVSIDITGISNSASYFSKSFMFLVDNGLNSTGNGTSVDTLNVTDVLYLNNIGTTDFSSYIFGSINKFENIYINSSINTISGGSSVNIASEYVDRVSDFLFNDYRATSLFTNSSTVIYQLNNIASNSGSILYAIDQKLHNLNYTSPQTYNNSTSSTVIMLENLLTKHITRFTDEPLTQVTSDNNAGAQTKIDAYNLANDRNYVGYQIPFQSGDLLQFGITIQVPTDQYTTPGIYDPNTSGSTTFSQLKVLVTLTLA
jgi:hypothetical protein